jgi:DNA-binding protein H-NS
MMDISRTPLAELLQLLDALPAEIDRRRSLERDRVMEELSALARARGFVLEDLVGKPTPLPAVTPAMPTLRRRRSPPVKYRHPRQYDLTWTGRGKRPRWVMAWLAEGNRMEELGVM